MAPSDFQYRFFDLDAVRVDHGLLSEEERARVERKRTPLLRQRQAASFQCLRRCLGEVLGVPPASLRIGIREGGKPFLPDHALAFNLSHSEGVGLLAWGEVEIGADVEALIARPSDALAAEILSPDEGARWANVPAERRQAWLTRTWCRKEAALKAVGEGLRIAPAQLDVGGGEGEGGTWACRASGRAWRGQDVLDGVPEGFRAAVCLLDA